MRISEKGIYLIKKYEGVRLDSYYCPAGILTIGYGHTGLDVFDNQKISIDEAERLLIKDLVKFEKIVNKRLKITQNQNQFDALVSHTYNTGGSDTLFKIINNRNSIDDIEYWWTSKYITADGIELKGLVKRRKEEFNIYIA